MGIPYISDHESDYAQQILFEGIEKIYQLVQPFSGYTQWHALLSRGEDRHDEPFFLPGFLALGLERSANPMIPPYVSLSKMHPEDKDFVTNRPFYEDPDPGPVSMWEWIYRDRLPGQLVANPFMRVHRQWAFPFWDHSRLEAAGLLRDPELPGPWCVSDLELEAFRSAHRLELLEETQRDRTKLWEAGRWGWYGNKDSSQAKSRIREPKHEEPTLYGQPQSLEKAKDFLKLVADLMKKTD